MLTDLKLSKAWISKIIQSRGFLRLINESSSSFGKNVLAPSGITAAASANDLGLQKKIHGSGTTTNNFKWQNEWHNENCSISWRF